MVCSSFQASLQWMLSIHLFNMKLEDVVFEDFMYSVDSQVW